MTFGLKKLPFLKQQRASSSDCSATYWSFCTPSDQLDLQALKTLQQLPLLENNSNKFNKSLNTFNIGSILSVRFCTFILLTGSIFDEISSPGPNTFGHKQLFISIKKKDEKNQDNRRQVQESWKPQKGMLTKLTGLNSQNKRLCEVEKQRAKGQDNCVKSYDISTCHGGQTVSSSYLAKQGYSELEKQKGTPERLLFLHCMTG